MKDRFSDQAKEYRKFRPDYPQELYHFILEKVSGITLAWDVGTGNGQAAVVLAQHFKQVWATDISESQLGQATQTENIHYHKARADKSGLPDHSVDLVVVAQALHWFANPAFFREVKRVSRPGALFAAWGYGLLQVNAEIDPLLQHFYEAVIGPYWDPERRHIDQQYQSISLPFPEYPELPEFEICRSWALEEVCGYIASWSAVQRYRQITGNDPVAGLQAGLQAVWKGRLKVRWPVFLRLARVQ